MSDIRKMEPGREFSVKSEGGTLDLAPKESSASGTEEVKEDSTSPCAIKEEIVCDSNFVEMKNASLISQLEKERNDITVNNTADIQDQQNIPLQNVPQATILQNIPQPLPRQIYVECVHCPCSYHLHCAKECSPDLTEDSLKNYCCPKCR